MVAIDVTTKQAGKQTFRFEKNKKEMETLTKRTLS